MRIVAGLLAILFLVGCAGKDKVPSGILPKAKMEDILWDMIQADQFSAIYLAKDSAHINLKMEDLRLYQQVFRLHQVSRDEFRKSLRYYENRPDLIRTVFDSLLSRGNRLRTESYNKTVPPPQAAVTPQIPPPGQAVKTPAAIPASHPPAGAPKGNSIRHRKDSIRQGKDSTRRGNDSTRHGKDSTRPKEPSHSTDSSARKGKPATV
jgi:hypothetical protein